VKRTGAAIVLFLLADPIRARAAPADYTQEVQELFKVVACAGQAPLPRSVPAPLASAHCADLARKQRRFRAGWLARAQPFLEKLVPADLPNRVVYPFGGGDLLTALVVFPKATEITTLSLEPAGDPRGLAGMDEEQLTESLAEVRTRVGHLFLIGHSKTLDMRSLARGRLPGELVYSLVALAVLGYEPVSLRYFRPGASGEPEYLGPEDLGRAPNDKARARMFDNLEMQFRAAGGGPLKTFRHLGANLDDEHLAANPGLRKHLESKGNVAAITKAASYLLWWNNFSTIRSYLLEHMAWMISDSTGVTPEHARAAGFEQLPFGHFVGPLFRGGPRPTEDFRQLWSASTEPLHFRFGYPDNQGHAHLLITRRVGR
jgi:hypothetical protein